eukprot:g24355.t1
MSIEGSSKTTSAGKSAAGRSIDVIGVDGTSIASWKLKRTKTHSERSNGIFGTAPACSRIYYTHDTINSRFKDHRWTLEDTVHQLQTHQVRVQDLLFSPISSYSQDIPALQVMYYHGRYFSIDNRRLWCFKKFAEWSGAELWIPVQVHCIAGPGKILQSGPKHRNFLMKFFDAFSTRCNGEYVDMAAKKQKLENGSAGRPPMVSWERTGASFFSMGEGTLKVPMAMHAQHRKKLCQALAGRVILVLRCRSAAARELWRMEKVYEAWCGPVKPPAWFQRAYEVEAAHVDEMSVVLEKMGVKELELLVLRGETNRDSGLQLSEPSFEGKEKFSINKEGVQILWDQLNECRVVRTPVPDELDRSSSRCSSSRSRSRTREVAKMKQLIDELKAKKHHLRREYRAAPQAPPIPEASFKYQAALRGCFRVGYSCICGSGRRNAILHYGHPAEPNSEQVAHDSLRLLDMGAEYHGYTSDVTCTFPVSGHFTAAQRTVYEARGGERSAVFRVSEMHRLSQRVLLERMTAASLFVGSVDDMMAAGLMFHFMPHGLGHQLGLDAHDVGGYGPGERRQDDPSIKENLRCGRDRLHDFWSSVGGVRIEDDVVITKDGCRVLTCVPRTVAEIEATMAGAEWQVSSSCCRSYTAVE